MKLQFITDIEGNRVAVIMPIGEFDRLLDELDEQNTVELYDKAKAEKLVFRPISEVIEKRIRNPY